MFLKLCWVLQNLCIEKTLMETLLFDKASSLLAMGKIYEGSAVVEEFRSPQAAETATALIHQVWRNPSAEEAAAKQ